MDFCRSGRSKKEKRSRDQRTKKKLWNIKMIVVVIVIEIFQKAQGKKTGGIENQRKNLHHPENWIVEISQNI